MQESETIEYKKSLAELSDGLNSIAAILNKHGRGALWFGIKNNGSPAGMDVSETTLRKVSQAIAAHIEPKIYPDVSKVVLDGKSCIRVTFTGSETPYYAHGRAYLHHRVPQTGSRQGYRVEARVEARVGARVGARVD